MWKIEKNFLITLISSQALLTDIKEWKYELPLAFKSTMALTCCGMILYKLPRSGKHSKLKWQSRQSEAKKRSTK